MLENNERDFCITIVIPYLIEKGHKIVNINSSRSVGNVKSFGWIRPDIVSIHEGITYITEVKVGRQQKRDARALQAVIGQLIIHQFVQQEQKHYGVVYQAVLPAKQGFEYFLRQEFQKFLHEFEIEVLLL